jgi:hypothetical protein
MEMRTVAPGTSVPNELSFLDTLAFGHTRLAEVCRSRLNTRRIAAISVLTAQPQWIREVDGVAMGETIEIEPAGQADRIFLGESPASCPSR